ncbi:FAD/NAD(P)-binding protein [Paracoccus benzoatiresistens]|uniref:FAD/NAD(P)-binding protein n=1 Tax=Paracoccus benzoatiresistens TaxID=2997341 RepID=A0ABT4IYW0_9RHOB|nr:FAD/NAD(P)-binding protein [Paracoccus sp. EF6]MCZ0960049.1 FAD/NAD(P)-binding protein [Paracoccus sp. EF6]
MTVDPILMAPLAPLAEGAGPHVVVIGGGASGVLMAAHLLRDSQGQAKVTIIEGRHMLGCGIAYSTDDPDHLLNTRAISMSAFPDQPRHFCDWLAEQGIPLGPQPGDSFVSRSTYGAYMASLIEPWSRGEGPRRLRCLRDLCVGLTQDAKGVTAHLSDGQGIRADMAVLATGHALPEPDPQGLVQGSWEQGEPPDRDDRVVIVGSGLSMIDQALSLLRRGHRGEILVVSRRAQLPRVHAITRPLPVALEDIPLGAPVSRLVAWLRALAARAEAAGGTWRDAMDGVRPHIRAIWQALPLAERARFLRHAASWWEVHRHRLPPESAAPIRAAIRTGRMRLLAASFQGAGRDAEGQLQAVIRCRGSRAEQRVGCARIIDCRGIRRDPERNATPVVGSLLRDGRARIDPLRLGLDVSPDAAVIDAQGQPWERIFAIGPASRAAFWEITAIPDIRDQTAQLARQLIALSARA